MIHVDREGINMSVYYRATCPGCEKRHELINDSLKSFTCDKCGKIFPLKTGAKNYYITFFDKGRRKRERIGPNKVLAEKALKKREVEVLEGKYLDIKKEEKIKFEVFADEYLELHCKTNNKCWFTNDSRLLTVLKRHFSGKYLHEITPHLIEKFKSDRMQEIKITPKGKKKKSLKPATVNRHLACLKSLFNKAIAWNKFTGPNPVRGVKLFKENNQRLRFLEKEEINKLFSVCNKNLRSIVTVAVYTGMRRGEILGLKWRDLDIKQGVIYLHNTKNGEKRELPINEQVKTALIQVRKHPQSEYIFCKQDGSNVGDIKKSFLTAIRKSGIKDFHFHDLRHTFASQLIMSGADLNTVRELLGHKSIQMTLRYSHLSANHKQRAVDILGRRIATVLPPEQLPVIKSKTAELVTL